MLSSVDPLRIYIYEEGLVRFATEKYTLAGDSLSNQFIHLTNFSINKNSEKFKNDKSESEELKYKWALSTLKEFMKQLGLDPNLMMMRIEDIIVKTIIGIERQLFSAYSQNVPFRDNCFQLFGFDILIDSALNPWLIEVNLSPSMGCSTSLDFDIKSKLLSDLLTVIGVPPKESRDGNYYRVNEEFMKEKDKEDKFDDAIKRNKKDGRAREMEIVQETREEVLRGENWKLIYPSYNVSIYQKFF